MRPIKNYSLQYCSSFVVVFTAAIKNSMLCYAMPGYYV